MVEKKNKKPKTKRVSKKLKISDIKRGEGATLTHLLHRIKSKEVELTAGCVVLCLVIVLSKVPRLSPEASPHSCSPRRQLLSYRLRAG